MAKVEDFFHKENISWASLCGVCTDGAPAMLGAKSGFQTLVKNKAPNVVTTHCFIHREALASKTFIYLMVLNALLMWSLKASIISKTAH